MRNLSEKVRHNFYLYGLYCPYTNELKYIGITTGTLKSRLNFHLRKPTNPKISIWFRELKENNASPTIKLIKECKNYNELLKSEISEILKYRELGYELFNISDGGDTNPMFGKTHTIEARKKISEHNKGLKRTEEQKEKRRILLKKLWQDGEWNNDTRNKIRDKLMGNKNSLGHKHTEYTRNLISKIRKEKGYNIGVAFFEGHKHSENTKELMRINNSGINNPMYGKRLSIDVLKKRSEKVIREKTYKGENNPNFKFKINKNDLIDLYIYKNNTIHEIAIIYGCCDGVIKNNLRSYEIKKTKSNKYNLNLDEINQYKQNGLNLIEIGKIYGCTNKIISKFIKKHKNGN